MAVLHFLNVGNGDCHIIQHNSERVTVVDVCKARRVGPQELIAARLETLSERVLLLDKSGNFQQKHAPENPIVYMRQRNIDRIFRFVLTHPDMDHMDGIKDLFDEFSPLNFWDTNNCREIDDWGETGQFREEDWSFYQTLREKATDPKCLIYHSGQPKSDFWQKDGLSILAPTPALVAEANDCGDFNDCSYVLLYSSGAYRTILAGDSHDATWEHILATHRNLVTNVDLLIAPHHGRKSDRSYEFLDVLNPSLTLFGNASHQHLAYGAWSNRDLAYVTNNQAGSVVVDMSDGRVFCTNGTFAATVTESPEFNDELQAFYFCSLPIRSP